MRTNKNRADTLCPGRVSGMAHSIQDLWPICPRRPVLGLISPCCEALASSSRHLAVLIYGSPLSFGGGRASSSPAPPLRFLIVPARFSRLNRGRTGYPLSPPGRIRPR